MILCIWMALCLPLELVECVELRDWYTRAGYLAVCKPSVPAPVSGRRRG